MVNSPILIIEVARFPEVGRSVEFLERQETPDLVIRKTAEYSESAKRGWLLNVKTSEGTLAAVAALFPMTPHTVEMGNAAVDYLWRGYRLHRLLIDIRAAIFAHGAAGADRLISAVDPKNKWSLRNLTGAGFIPLLDPPPEFFDPCSTCVKRAFHSDRCCCDSYFLPEDARRIIVRDLLARGTPRQLQNKYGKKINVHIEISALRHLQRLEVFAASDSSEVIR